MSSCYHFELFKTFLQLKMIADETDDETALFGVLQELEDTGASSSYICILRGVQNLREHKYLQAKSLLSEGMDNLTVKCQV
jgi:hypothetical protein